ncbi:gamma-interferon-inducible lysosomal thiol reductase [Apis mellifera caucasica]|uniref:Gamma-interferon-inducible lysosomal thiol reductase n=1 Tax=Apis mellifera TaxID=7460 RepID=A0A7M7M5A5_APIME|nr:gamma-interferon-inducible lysosomal thiol reductase [Apis mellifera]KAG6795733.1 gamma-interferon-inducible lysosomal thiol reductase [Apis mellifera caucasica]KAG9430033.1 gamma-interferon-inducible lysosomal thiol reductase [Apis mellifera carnica]|eukprot:XP_016770902.1 gamma-interferon-inducible lysosomal thiol reductase [Apis mellifera]
MGLGIFRWKILLIILSVLLFWQSSKIWLNFTQGKSGIKAQLQDNQPVTLSQKDEKNAQKIHIAIYYEALCPDSRSFFIKQLLPTYHRIPDNVRIEFIPYGKAMTLKTEDGYEFKCQHGPIECAANIIHACSIDILKNSSIKLEYLSCMIKNNMIPKKIMETCAKKMNIDYNPIFKCYNEEKGKELLAEYGKLTNVLIPRISFIPTVVINGSSENQARILKNLLQEVCSHFKIIPEGCIL